jgi:hypothetical protein
MKAFEPSAAEIRERCRAIQQTWTKTEQRKRCAVQAVPAEIHLATLVRYQEGD